MLCNAIGLQPAFLPYRAGVYLMELTKVRLNIIAQEEESEGHVNPQSVTIRGGLSLSQSSRSSSGADSVELNRDVTWEVEPYMEREKFQFNIWDPGGSLTGRADVSRL